MRSKQARKECDCVRCGGITLAKEKLFRGAVGNVRGLGRCKEENLRSTI